MAQYPFDQKFRSTIDHLPDWEDDGWSLLISHPEAITDAIYKDLAEIGYSREVVYANIAALISMPISDLFTLARAEIDDSPALLTLQTKSDREVFEEAAKLCQLELASDRDIGVRILMRKVGLTFKEEAAEVVKNLAKVEKDGDVLTSLAYAHSHLDINDSSFLAKLATSANFDTRHAAACALCGLHDDVSINTKITLSRDNEVKVRDWATTALYLPLDNENLPNQQIKDALFDRLFDHDQSIRHEALVGLARCKDERVIAPLIIALQAESVWNLAIEAARELAHPALRLTLLKLQKRFPDDIDIEKAIIACSDPNAQ